MYYQNYQNQRSDNQPGYIYLIEAVGYHGFLPGCYLRRCKIGCSRNPQLRLENFNSNQPPCDLRILRTIFVQDMKTIEEQLHHRFQNSKVKLVKSREWFDLTPRDFIAVNWALSRCDRAANIRDEFTSRAVAAKILVGSGLALLIATAASGQWKQKPELFHLVVRHSLDHKKSH